jgi:hypothetical protein
LQALNRNVPRRRPHLLARAAVPLARGPSSRPCGVPSTPFRLSTRWKPHDRVTLAPSPRPLPPQHRAALCPLCPRWLNVHAIWCPFLLCICALRCPRWLCVHAVRRPRWLRVHTIRWRRRLGAERMSGGVNRGVHKASNSDGRLEWRNAHTHLHTRARTVTRHMHRLAHLSAHAMSDGAVVQQ